MARSALPQRDDGGGIDLVAMYFNDIAKYEPLSLKEELALAKRVKKGDKEAEELLVKSNSRFVVRVAIEYENPVVPLIERIQAGNLGLITGIRRFNPSKGFKLISYAVWWIRQAILQLLAEHSRTIMMPINRNAELLEISKVAKILTWALGHEPSLYELAGALWLDSEQTKELEFLKESGSGAISLDRSLEDEESRETLLDFLEDKTTAPDRQDFDIGDLLPDVKALVDEREYRILRMYFGLEGSNTMTLEQVGQVMGVTRERVRQIRNIALAKLRRRLLAAKYAH